MTETKSVLAQKLMRLGITAFNEHDSQKDDLHELLRHNGKTLVPLRMGMSKATMTLICEAQGLGETQGSTKPAIIEWHNAIRNKHNERVKRETAVVVPRGLTRSNLHESDDDGNVSDTGSVRSNETNMTSAIDFSRLKVSGKKSANTVSVYKLIKNIVWDVSQPTNTARVETGSARDRGRALTQDEWSARVSSKDAKFQYGRVTMEVSGPVTVEDLLDTVRDLVRATTETFFGGIDLNKKNGKWTVLTDDGQ